MYSTAFLFIQKIKSASIFSVKTFFITTEKILTFCRSWEPEYLAAIDLISPPNAEAQSFTLWRKKNETGRNVIHMS